MNKIKNILLHMGPDKTGSTAIQSYFNNNKKIFEEHGVIYSAGSKKNDRKLSVAFCSSFERAEKLFNVKQEKYDNAKNYLTIIKEKTAASMAETLLLSHEGLMALNKNELQSLREFLKEIAENIYVVLYAREPVSYATSAMSQRVKTGRKSSPSPIPPHLAYKTNLEIIVDIFGRTNIDVRKFDKNFFPDENVVNDFMSIPLLSPLKNINKKYLLNDFSRNVGLSNLGLCVGDRIISLLSEEKSRSFSFKDKFLSDLCCLEGDRPMLSKSNLAKLKVISSVHVKYLEDEFGIVFSDNSSYSNRANNMPSCREQEKLAVEIITRCLPSYKISKIKLLRRHIVCLLKDTFVLFKF